MMTDILAENKSVSFARIPDPAGDSATFLNLLLPDRNSARVFVELLQAEGVGGFNYWFTNMYHFINQWDHLKEMKTAAKLPAQVFGLTQDYQSIELPESQQVVSRLISFGIRCTWKEEEVIQLAEKLSAWVSRSVKQTA